MTRATDRPAGVSRSAARASVAALGALLLSASHAAPATEAADASPRHPAPATTGERGSAAACPAGPATTPPTRVELRATRRAQGASGTMILRFASSPYGVAVSPDGFYLQRLELRVEGVRAGAGRALVAWVATPDLERHERLGTIRPGERLEAEVSWNKFLVFVTEEASADVDDWSQEILLTARSPSSYMHSMAGHGPFSSEPCLDPTL